MIIVLDCDAAIEIVFNRTKGKSPGILARVDASKLLDL